MMTRPPVRAPLPRAAALCALSLALVAAACETPGPVNPAPASRDRTYSAVEATAVQAALTPREAMRRYYPEVLTRGAGEQNRFFFVIGQDGQVAEHLRGATETGSGAGMRLDPIAGLRTPPNSIGTIDIMKMAAGQMGPGPVDIIWIQVKEAGRATAAGSAPVTASAPVTENGTATSRTLNITATGNGAAAAQRVTVTPVTAAGGATITARAAGSDTVPRVDAARVRAAIQQHLPRVAREGTSADHVWFLTSAAGQVVAFGEGDEGMNDAVWPAEIGSIQLFKGEGVTLNGHEIPVIWATKKN